MRFSALRVLSHEDRYKNPMATWPREKLLLSLRFTHTHWTLPSPCSNVTKLKEDPQKIGVTHSLGRWVGWVACSLIHWADGQPLCSSNFCSCQPQEGTRGKIHGHSGLYPLQQKNTIVQFPTFPVQTSPNKIEGKIMNTDWMKRIIFL